MSGRRPERLFVYGSLRSDAPRRPELPTFAFEALRRGARLIGPGWVTGTLYAVSWYPGFVDSGAGRVRGEVWEVHGPNMWAVLDSYEGDAFLRQPHRIDLDDGRRVTAWLYMYRSSRSGISTIPSGDYVQWIAAADPTP